jgi:hypothetical protein
MHADLQAMESQAQAQGTEHPGDAESVRLLSSRWSKRLPEGAVFYLL